MNESSDSSSNATPERRPTVAILIPSLGVGGAERQASELARNLDASRFRVLLVTFDDISGSISSGVCRVSVGGKTGFGRLRRLANIVRTERVEILQAFLLSAQIYALGVRLLCRGLKVVAAVRASMGLKEIVGWKGKLSHVAVFGLFIFFDQFVFNSAAGERAIGGHLPSARKRVIANGIDTRRFEPDSRAHERLRTLATLPDNALVVGMIANVNIDKGYETFVLAAATAAAEHPNVYFVVIGDYQNPLGARVRAQIDRHGLTTKFRFLGSRPDVEAIIPGMDVVCSASSSEGFSNAIAEAMACGVPCVVTDVGDSARIVGDTGVIVPPNDPVALASGLIRMLSCAPDERRRLGQSARSRVETNFSVPAMVETYEDLYRQLLRERPTSS